MAKSISLRQIRAVIAVCEERSFTRAAARENEIDMKGLGGWRSPVCSPGAPKLVGRRTAALVPRDRDGEDR